MKTAELIAELRTEPMVRCRREAADRLEAIVKAWDASAFGTPGYMLCRDEIALRNAILGNVE